MVVRAWRLCSLTVGTPAFSLALFVSIPVIYFPFAFFVLTGFYEIDLANSIFAAGLLNLVHNYHQKLVSNAAPGTQTQAGASQILYPAYKPSLVVGHFADQPTGR